MALIEANAETWLRVSTEITLATAQMNDLLLRIRRGELVEASKFDAMIFGFAHRVRDQLLSAPARHAAVLAAERGLDAAAVLLALDGAVRRCLTRLAERDQTKPK